MWSTLLRLLLAMLAAVIVYLGQYWARRNANACGEADQDRLAAVGTVMLVVGVASIVSLLAGRVRVSGAATVLGVGLIVVGYGIGIGCLQ
jgi:type VI protein secretion system component VasK